jgi:hypothetical protein
MSGRILVLGAYLRREKPDFVFTVGESLLRRLIKAAPRFDSPGWRCAGCAARDPNRRLPS